MHQRGDFSKCDKVTTNVADLFAPVECTGHPYTLLIEGAPGIGKTVLAKEIVFRWANGILLKSERLVFLIYLRDPKTKKIYNFESLLHYYINYPKISKSIEQYIGSTSGKGVTLVFDGYDEYPERLRNNSYLSDVINHKVLELHSCNIIITSRPSASACLHNYIDLRVEILGFTKEHRKSYIVHALKDNPNAIQDLLEYLESNYSVDAYCHVPLSMAVLVFLYKDSGYDKTELPTTQTAINYKFVRIIIRRFIRRFQDEPLNISTFSEVPKPYKQILLEISELAFKALQEDNIVFSANEIRDFCPSLVKDTKYRNGLDLLKAVEYFNSEEIADELSFNFLHFSVQELLAAYHISLMSETNQIKVLKNTFWNSRYFNTWIMYVALTKDQPFAFRHFLSGNKLRLSTKFSKWWTGNAYIGISKNMKESKIKRLHLFQCFTEAGNNDMCKYIGNLLQDGTIDLSGQTLSAIELYTLSSFFARCIHKQWSLLDLSNCYLDDENFGRFYKSYASLTKSTVYINTVNLSSNAFTEVSASQIANLILNFNVKKIVFSSNQIKDIGIDQATFVALLEHPNLSQSRFIEIQDENQVNLVLYKKGLSKSIASEFFMLCYCTIEAYEDVCLHIKNNNSFLEMLINASSVSIFKTMLHSLVNKMIVISTNFKLYVKTVNSTNEEINSIVTSLASNVPLAVRIGESCLPLHLCNAYNGNKMFSNVGTFLFHGKFSIKTVHSMFSLFLGENDLNQIYLNGITLDDSFIDYVSPKCTSLNSLQLVNCYIHDITIPNAVANVLSQVLSNTKFLQHLNLSGCRLKTEHMKIILEALKQVVSIITISLSNNNLAKSVFDVLAFVITCNRQLNSIELSNCDLRESGIVSITKALENCTDLQSLDLSNNVIGDNSAVNIAILIEKCQSLQDLRLQSCQLHYAGIQTIVEVMVKKTCLYCIDLSDNAISDENSVLIASVIANNKNLQKIYLSNCKLQSIGCQQLLQAMAKITVLRHVNLSNNLLTGVEADSFASMIHQNIDLEYLNISGCCDKPKDFEKVTGSLVTLKSLNFLDLSCNVINITSGDNIATIITNNAFLEDLDLSKCELRKSAFLKIIIALQNIHHLKCLYLNSYSVDHEEATRISMIISNSPFLENVDLSNCNLTEKELKTILSSLRNHTSLKHFDISCNTITNHVANEIVDVIDSNTQLTHLNISDSHTQEYGILKIFKAVQRISTLKCIKMSKCTISDKAAQAIAIAITVNCMMEELVFNDNDFHETGIALVFDVLKEAHTLKCLTVASNKEINNVTTKVTEVVFNNHITYFDLSNCDLQKSSCSLVLNSLILQTPNLQHIDLHCNNLNGTAETIAQLISVSYYLQYINLANTLMQDEEVMIIVKAMQNINSLRHVDLTSYSIDDELALELQSTIDKNGAVIYFQFSRLCLKKIEVTIMTLGESSIVVNLQEISIHFGDCENDQVDAAASLINNSPDLQYLQLESCSVLEINFSNIIIALARTTTLEYFSLINVVVTDKVDDGIAAVLENNTQLKYFKLVACKLTGKGLAKYIQLFNMTRLSHLVLSKMDNLINHTTRQLKRPICDSLTHLNLSNVHLNVTKLSFLSLPSLTKLQHLDLSHNPLTDESAGILTSVICNNHGLKHLNLCECKLQSEGIRVISNSLQAINIVYLDMSLNTIDIDIFNNNAMPVLFSNLSVVECLHLPYCELKEKEIHEILDFSSIAVHLKFIDFGPNTIPKDMISDFKNIIFVSKGNKQICFSTEGLKKVNFNNYETENLYFSLHYLNINNIIVDDEVANTVAALIANSPELEHLEMAGGEWTFASAMKCFRAFQTTKKLIYLNLSNNSFTLTELLSLLTNFIALKFLHLRECGLKSTGIIPLTTLSTVTTLNYLDLSSNSIDDEAVDYLTVLIATNVGLEYLSFCNCKVSFSGIQNISSALKVTSSLEFLDINFSDVEGKSLDQVATLLPNYKHLKQLRLSNLVLDNNMFHQIQSSLPVIKELQRLTINNCVFTDRDISTIISLVANNSTLHELTLLNCEMSMKGKIKFTCFATALCLQCLKFDSITVTDIKHSPSTSLHCKYNLTDDDVVAVMIVNNYVGEFIMFKLIVNQNSLKVLSANTVTVRHLKVLHIKDCIFTDYYAHYVAFLITNNVATIQSFSLTSCEMSMIQRMIITEALSKLNIQHLNIKNILYNNKEYEARICLYSCFTVTNCKLTDEIITAVMVSNKSLRISKLLINQSTLLELRKTLFVNQGNKKTSFIIFHALRYLNINNITVDDKVTNTVANLIANSPELEHLEMIGGGWTFTSAMKCFRAFQTTKKLIYLNLSNNSFTLTELLSLLTNFIALKFLHLHECGLKSTGIIPLTTLSTVTTLNYLDVSSNSIDDEAADYLAVLIATNGEIEHLNFCDCKLSFSGIQNISSALKLLSSLKFLDIRFNSTDGKDLHDDVVETILANSKHLEQLNLFNLVLDNGKFHQMKSQLVIKGLEQLIISDCIFTDEDVSRIISLVTNNSTLHELTLLNCEMSMKGKIKFTCFATALCLQCLKFDSITVTDIKHSPSTSLHCKYNLTDDDVVAVMIVNNYVGEFIMFKLIVNQNILKVLSANTVTVRHLKVLHIKDCIFTDYYAHYVAFLITNNVATIQSFSLTSCEMSMIQRMIITEALSKLNIQHLNIKNILYNNKEYEARICLYSCFTVTNCKLTDEIITAVMVSNKSLRISKLLINQSTLLELRKTLFVNQGNKKTSFIIFHALRYLNINNITVDDKVTNTVANLIANSPELEHLEMIGGGWTFTSAMKCFRAFQTTKKLIYLNLSNNSFTLTELLSLLTNFIALKFLHLHECGLKSTGIIPLTTLSTVTTLNYLDVSSNSIDDEAADYLAVLIATNGEIEHLNFCDCKLSFSGIQNISSALKLLSSLKFLDIRFNSTDGKDLHDDVVETILANSKHLEQLNLFNLVLDNGKFHQMKSQLVIKGLEQLIISDCIFTDEDVSRIISLVTNNSTLHELTLLNCEMSMKGKIKFTCFATALCLQCLKFDSITVTDIKHSPSTSLHCKYNLTDDDVVAVMIVNNYVGEFIMFKLIVNQNSLKVLSANTVTVRHLKVLHIKDCIFTDYYAHYVAFLITNNVATIQSFSLTSCEMSMIQRMIITEALSKLNIQHLNIKNILYNNKEYEARICLYSCFTVTNCKLTDEIITAVMVSNKSLRISKLLINQSTLLELRKTLFVNQGNKKTSFIIFHALRYLNINNITVDDKVTNTVANLIANSPELEHLEMIGGGWTFTSAMKCFRAFQTTKKLIYLNLSNNSFTLTELLSLLTNFIALKFLHLHECGLKSTGIIPLTTLSTVTTLNYLDVSSNSIDDEAADYLAVLIATNVEIEHLNFCDCKLSFSGIQNISSALKLLSSLKFLDIRFNITDGKDLHDDVVVTILANSKHLEQLNLFNLVLDNGKFHQMKSQLVIKGLEQLIISDCIFTDEDVSRIISLVTNNSTLREVCLFHCKMSVKSKVQFISITTVHGIYVVFEV